MQQLRGQPAHQLLMALALFPQPALVEAVAHAAFSSSNLNFTQQSLAKLYQLSLVESRQGSYDMHSLTRRYSSTELSMNPDFEQKARNRWVVWYLNFLMPYGEKNWRDWQEYSPLEQEWENLREVIEWCKEQERYEDFKQFWQKLKGYTQIYGHWHERLSWMDWLIEAAQKQEDWATVVGGMYHTSRTLYLFNQAEQTKKAIALSQQAWELPHSQDSGLQVDLAIHLAALYSQQRQFDEAFNWLNQGQDLLKHISKEDQTHSRQWIEIFYYKAKICLKTKNYKQAKRLYSEALDRAEAIGWQRIICYIKGWLAAVAIAQGNLDEAQELLEVILPLAKRNNDKRCLTFCQSYFALLERARGNLTATHCWAKSAKEGFERLNMKEKAAEMNVLLGH